MSVTTKNGKLSDLKFMKKTALNLLTEHEETSHFLAGCPNGKPVSIIILCDGSAVFDEKILGETPHLSVNIEDDLLQTISELHEENIKLRSLSLMDNLTGLYNNRFFWSQLEIEIARSKRTGNLCSLMMIDLDNFKLLNDTLGHLEGDRFLAEFSRIMHTNCRATDLIYRYGGDEFAIIMPATAVTEAIKTGERFRDILREMPQKTNPAITLSIGISEYSAYSSYDINEFVNTADLSMYKAKKGGKNMICVDENWEKRDLQISEVNSDEKEFLLMEYH
jgi:diguanylate cyclase (GGDEF)-like protein